MDLGRIKVFYTIVKVGSFTKAARILNISQPAVTHSLQLFEQSVKSKLINRSTRGFTLTSEGERVFELAERIMQETERFWKTFRDEDSDSQGQIKIHSTPYFAETDLLHYLIPYLKERPELTVEILTSLENFDTHQVDVAIRTLIPYRQDLAQLPLTTYHVKLWASKEYLDKFGVPKTPKDLDNHRLLAYGIDVYNVHYKNSHVDWLLSVGNDTGKLREAFFRISSHQGLYRAARDGLGIIQLPIETVKLRKSKLVPVLPDLDAPKIDMYFACNRQLIKTKRIQYLYDYLSQCFQKDRRL